MKYKFLSLVLLLSMLAGFAACDKNGETADVPPSSPETENVIQSPNSTQPAGTDENAAAVSHPEPAINNEEEPPALSEADYIASAKEILLAVLGENAPDAETADINVENDAITERLEAELTYSVGDGQVVITFDKETGRLRGLSRYPFDGFLKPARHSDPESTASAWYAALPLPRDYALRSVVPYGDWLCYEFNKPVTLETGGEPVELFSSYEAVRIMVLPDTGALLSVVVFHWPVFDGYSEKTAISEAEAVETARQSRSISGEAELNAQIGLFQSNDAVSLSYCPRQEFANYSFPAWEVTFQWDNEFKSKTVIYVDLYTGEILGSAYVG